MRSKNSIPRRLATWLRAFPSGTTGFAMKDLAGILPAGIQPASGAVVLSQFAQIGLLRNIRKGHYELTPDVFSMDIDDVVALHREHATQRAKDPSRARRTRNAPPPPPAAEVVEVEPLDLFRQLGVDGVLEVLGELLREPRPELAALAEREAALQAKDDETARLRHDLDRLGREAERLRGDLKTERESVMALRQEVAKRPAVRPERERPHVIPAYPVSGGGGGGHAAAQQGGTPPIVRRRMKVHKRPLPPSAGGVVAVYRRRTAHS